MMLNFRYQRSRHELTSAPQRLAAGFTGSILLLAAFLAQLSHAAESYDGQRWFQIEVSIFSHESPSDREAELWSADRLSLNYPSRLRKMDRYSDKLMIAEFAKEVLGVEAAEDLAALGESNVPSLVNDGTSFSTDISRSELLKEALAIGPFRNESAASFSFFDTDRAAYLRLGDDASDFQQTNRALRRSPSNRLLFHSVWRQPMLSARRASPLLIQGGERVGDEHELQGSITLRFNDNEDRVVIDANLWLTEFTPGPSDDEWQLPELPTAMLERPEYVSPEASRAPENTTSFSPRRIYQMIQSREMRSDEFHYIDHPAIGLVVLVRQYDLPVYQPPTEETFQTLDEILSQSQSSASELTVSRNLTE